MFGFWPSPVIYSIVVVTFWSLHCALPTTQCAGVSLDRRAKGTAEHAATRSASQKEDAFLRSWRRTLWRDPASKAAKNFEQVAKTDSGLASKFKHCKSYENGNPGNALWS